MSLFDAIVGRRKAVADHSTQPVEAITLADNDRPSWATGTGLYRAIEHPLTVAPEQGPVIPVPAVRSAKPLPRRREAVRR